MRARSLRPEVLETRVLLTTFVIEPGESIQAALNAAMPGDTVYLNSGEHAEDIRTARDGRADAPITITGDADAVLKGEGASRLFEVNHDYYVIQGFTIDGLHGDGDSSSDYSEKLVFAIGTEALDGVEGMRVLHMTFLNAGDEALRLRYYATNNEIAYNTFVGAGVKDFVFNAGGKNGEAVYIGTSSNQWNDGKNPTSGPDISTGNWVHHNYFDTRGNEAVDIKAGSTGNIVEYNIVTGQLDPNSGGLDSRGDANVFRFNEVFGNAGAGIRVGGSTVDGIEYGKNNDVYGNYIHDNESGGIKFQVSPQGEIHGNLLENNVGGDSVGSFADEFNPAEAPVLWAGIAN